MIESKRMNSIARRVSTSYLARMLFTLLLVNAFLVVNVAVWTAYGIEKAALGSAWQADLAREIRMDETLSADQRISSMEYRFSIEGQEPQIVRIGPVITTVFRSIIGVLFAESLLVFLQYRGFKRRTLYLLTPLRQMAQTAEELSRVQFDEQKYHSLEDAIEKLSVQSPGARLATGHSELSGLENAVNNLISRMHDAYRQQTRFVSDASHELRTPIAVIRGYADLLSRWGKDDRKVMDESVEAIKGEADNMQRLVEQLLFLARGDAGRTPFSPARVDLGKLVTEAHEEYTLINQNHIWRLKADEPVLALGDEAMLKQALRIMADNAIKFSPPGSAITLRAFNAEKGMACLSVQDNGAGIKAEDLPHIFERFYRSDPARSRGGTGLGLSIAKWIADRHAGHIDVYSSEGLGSRFTLNLPAFKAEQPITQEKKDQAIQTTA